MSADDYVGIVHVNEACTYCDPVVRVNPDPWEWYARRLDSARRARFTWVGVVRNVAYECGVLVHPTSAEGSFWVDGPSAFAASSKYVALPLYAEEALRHVQYEERALRRLFTALADKDVRTAAGAAWSLGGRWALRDYLRTAGAIG